MSKVNVDLSGFGAKAGQWAAQGVNAIVANFQGIDLYAIGSKVISDFLAGLQSMWGSLMSWVSGAVARLKALFSFNISLPSISGGGGPGAPAGVPSLHYTGDPADSSSRPIGRSSVRRPGAARFNLRN